MKKLLLGIMFALFNGCLASDSLENGRKRSSTTDLGLFGLREAEKEFVERSKSLKPSNTETTNKKKKSKIKAVLARFSSSNN